MFSFRTATCNYINIFPFLCLGSYEYDTIEGNIRFTKIDNFKICIDSVYIKPILRNRKIFKNFLHYIIDTNIKNFYIISVINKMLYNYLIRFEYKKCKFKLLKEGFKLKKRKLTKTEK
jgi:hypothetical protein